MSLYVYPDATDEAIKRLMYYRPWVAIAMTPEEAARRIYAVAKVLNIVFVQSEFFDLCGSLAQLSFTEPRHRAPFAETTMSWLQHFWRYNGDGASEEFTRIVEHEKALRVMLLSMLAKPDLTPAGLVADARRVCDQASAEESNAMERELAPHISEPSCTEVRRRFLASTMGEAYRTMAIEWDRRGASAAQRHDEWFAALKNKSP